MGKKEGMKRAGKMYARTAVKFVKRAGELDILFELVTLLSV